MHENLHADADSYVENLILASETTYDRISENGCAIHTYISNIEEQDYDEKLSHCQVQS